MKRQLMKEVWNEFASKYVPRNATANCVSTCAKASYAGAHQILFRVIEGLAPESEHTNEDLQLMQDAVVQRFRVLDNRGHGSVGKG
jgi:hypothetical protein